jgi:hypothetical protein
MDVLLVIGNQLCNLDEHFILFCLRNEFVFTDQFDEILFNDFLFECLTLFNLDIARGFSKAELMDESFDVSI